MSALSNTTNFFFQTDNRLRVPLEARESFKRDPSTPFRVTDPTTLTEICIINHFRSPRILGIFPGHHNIRVYIQDQLVGSAQGPSLRRTISSSLVEMHLVSLTVQAEVGEFDVPPLHFEISRLSPQPPKYIAKIREPGKEGKIIGVARGMKGKTALSALKLALIEVHEDYFNDRADDIGF